MEDGKIGRRTLLKSIGVAATGSLASGGAIAGTAPAGPAPVRNRQAGAGRSLSHLDLTPTLIGLTGASAEVKAGLTRQLPGKDFSRLLAAPEKASPRSVRDGALYCYNTLAYIDGAFSQAAVDLLSSQGGKEKLQAAAKSGQLAPDLRKRGAIRSVFDGRYQLTRYFSPTEHNRPTSLDALFRLNDVELFDLERDPQEIDNLALDRKTHAALLEEMNARLNALIDESKEEQTPSLGRRESECGPGVVERRFGRAPEALWCGGERSRASFGAHVWRAVAGQVNLGVRRVLSRG